MHRSLVYAVAQTVVHRAALCRLQPASLLLLWVVASGAMLGGCFDEKKNLIGPIIGGSDSAAAIRFANFVDDTKPRKVNINGTTDEITPRKLILSNSVNGADSLKMERFLLFGNMTALRFVSLDSAVAGLLGLNASQAYFLSNKIRFSPRTSYNTVIAIGSPTANVQDTLITITTPRTPEARANNAFTLRVVNAYSYPDAPQITFSMRLGCPSGQSIVQNLATRSLSNPTQLLPENTVTLSLIASQANRSEVSIGTFTFAPKALGYYTAIICRDPTANDTILIPARLAIVDETSLGTGFLPVTRETEQRAFVQFINLSRSPGTGSTNGKPQSMPLSPEQRSIFATVTTCSSTNADVVAFGNAVESIALSSNNRYAMIATDSANGQNLTAIPLYDSTNTPAQATARLRLVNLAWDDVPERRLLSVVTGARSANGVYSPETVLRSGLRYGEVSDVVNLAAGPLPLMVFSGELPQRLLQTGIENSLVGGKNYLLVVTRVGTAMKLYMIDEAQTGSLSAMNAGALVRAVNAYAGDGSLTCSVGSPLQNASVAFGQTLTTVVPTGNVAISTTNPAKTASQSLVEGQRGLAIITGTSASDLDVSLQATTPPNLRARDTAFVRFFNGASGPASARVQFTLNPNPNFGGQPFGVPPDTAKIDSATWVLIKQSAATDTVAFHYKDFSRSFPARIATQQRSRILAWNPAFVNWDSSTLFATWNSNFKEQRVFADVSNVLFPYGTASMVVLVRSRDRVVYDALPDNQRPTVKPPPYILLFVQEY
jgi:hypothetical protein